MTPKLWDFNKKKDLKSQVSPEHQVGEFGVYTIKSKAVAFKVQLLWFSKISQNRLQDRNSHFNLVRHKFLVRLGNLGDRNGLLNWQYYCTVAQQTYRLWTLLIWNFQFGSALAYSLPFGVCIFLNSHQNGLGCKFLKMNIVFDCNRNAPILAVLHPTLFDGSTNHLGLRFL